MTLDASAIIAIVCKQPGWEGLVTQVTDADEPRVPATALAEAGMVLVAREGMLALLAVSEVVSALKLTVVPFTERDWHNAVCEYHDRRQSADVAAARFGACLSAAVAARTGTPLLTGPPQPAVESGGPPPASASPQGRPARSARKRGGEPTPKAPGNRRA